MDEAVQIIFVHPEIWMENVGETILPRLRHARVLVHFHSDFSLLGPLSSSNTSGTQPPNTNMREPSKVAEWRERGRGWTPPTVGRSQFMVSEEKK